MSPESHEHHVYAEKLNIQLERTHWSIEGSCSNPSPVSLSTLFEIIDLKLEISIKCRKHNENQLATLSPGIQDLLSLLATIIDTTKDGTVKRTVKLIIPTKEGFIIQGKCFQDRFADCQRKFTYIDRSQFGAKHQPKTTFPVGALADLLDLSVLVISERDSFSALDDTGLGSLDEEITNRITFQWLMDTRPEWRKIALVHGRDDFQSLYPIYQAAYKLGIKLVLLDEETHWVLRNKDFEYLYEAFLPIDMTIDENFCDRITEALKEYGHVDGICTVSDRCIISVARAASQLNLPTEPVAAISMSVDKYRTRQIHPQDCQSMQISTLSELDAKINSGEFEANFPLVVKPSSGWSSEYVYKVSSKQDLRSCVEKVSTRPNASIVVESYIDGPEVDANFVLCDGKIIFFEVGDDFPSSADEHDAGVENDFFESASLLPSALQESEIMLIRENLHQTLLKVGLKNGIFHLEARLKDSMMRYNVQNGIQDLRLSQRLSDKEPRCFLIEINPRPPGFPLVYAVRNTYGVDYFAMHILACLQDYTRLQALAQPFNSRGIGNHAQYWCELLFIRGGKGGVCATADPCGDLFRRFPEVAQHVSMAVSFYKKGDLVPEMSPKKLVFLAFFLVWSRKAREDVLKVSEIISSEFGIELE